MRRRFLFPALMLAVAAPVTGQQQAPKPAPPGEVVDRIVAVVGDSIILMSQVEEQLAAMEQQAGRPLPRSDSAAMAKARRETLEQLIEFLIVVQAAARDTTIRIKDSDIAANVDRVIAQRQAAVGGPAQFEAALRRQMLTYNEYREILLVDARKQTLYQQKLGQMTRSRRPPPVSETEARKAFEERKSQLGIRPAWITFHHIEFAPRGSDSARAVARAKADSILQLVVNGENFGDLAKRFSEDGSAANGGDLGWSRPSDWVPEFAAAVMLLRQGEVSPVVETMYGFHIIKLEKAMGGQRQARHILIKPVLTDEDGERAMQRGREIVEQLKKGANFDSIAKQVNIDPSASTRAEMPLDTLARLSPEIAAGARTAVKDQVIGPVRMEDGKITIIKVDAVREAGPYTWDEPAFRTQFRESLQQQKLIEEIMGELRRQTHVEIRT